MGGGGSRGEVGFHNSRGDRRPCFGCWFRSIVDHVQSFLPVNKYQVPASNTGHFLPVTVDIVGSSTPFVKVLYDF